jgi:acyl-CoA synthetase (AMP-forming)/AMP-acid ligase II
MSRLLHLGEILSAHARLRPDNIGARDLARAVSYRKWNERACRLANALGGIGLVKGDRVAVLAYNRVEWLEIYAATAKAGLVAVPINFRLLGAEIRYIVQNCEASALIVEHDLLEPVESVRDTLPIAPDRYIVVGANRFRAGYRDYEALLGRAAPTEPEVEVAPDDTWTLMYTSGTTGKPKGAIRSHNASVQHALITALDQNFRQADTGLLVMPLCHSNSLWYATLLAYCGASCVVYNRKSFDPEHVLRTLFENRISFTSLVPTHYIMMQGLPAETRARYSAESVDKLLISSAPARKDTKLAVMEQFRNSRLFEGYGSTEAGWVTLLRPDEQIDRLGSIGRELTGSARIRLLDEEGREVGEGEVGEIYSRTPYTFSGYWKLPDKTAEAFKNGYCSVGDMGRRDPHGYYFLADRKSNMIISGGENIYPSEIENLLGAHPKVKDVAVIGVPDAKWGESVHAVVVLRGGQSATASEMLDWCSQRIAGYKRPRSISFIAEEEMPRTATGKILHRELRARFSHPKT